MLLLEKLFTFLAPYNCLMCGREGKVLCDWCVVECMPPVPSRCYRCYSVTPDCAVCMRCRRVSNLGQVWVACDYGGVSKELLYLLKFNRVKAAAPTIADLMQARLPYFDDNVTIVHIPAATSRVRMRGYDQSGLIAKVLAQKLRRRHIPLLARQGQTRQVGAKREIRVEQVKGSLYVRKAYVLKNAHVLLIDDVVTTGATLEEAARVLKTEGARRVDAAVFAQKR